MSLSHAISTASRKELHDLAAYLTAEFEMQSQDSSSGEVVDVDIDNVANALAAWAYMHANEDQKGGD